MTPQPFPQPVLIRLSDVSDVGVSTAHRTAYVTTTLPAIVQGLRTLECQPDPFNAFQGPDALLDGLLAMLSGMESHGVDRGALVRAALCQEITRREDAEREIATLRRERDEARAQITTLRDGVRGVEIYATGKTIVQPTHQEFIDRNFVMDEIRAKCNALLRTTPTQGAQA